MPDVLCKGNRGRRGCKEIVVDGGVEGTGFCETCHYPSIVEDRQRYSDLIAEGYTRYQAGLMSGLEDPHDPHEHLKTIPIDNVEQDQFEDEHTDRRTSELIDEIEDENDDGT